MRYLEDFAVGQHFPTPSLEVTEADIKAFAVRFDPQSMHLDGEAATRGPLGGLSASGWHTTALVMRLIVEANLFNGGPVLGLGVDDLRWPAPVRPGDKVSAEIEVVSITPSKSKSSHGVLRVHVRARNQKGDVVLSMFPKLWVPRNGAH